MVNDTVVKFKIDTGADVTGIHETMLKQIKNRILQSPERPMPKLTKGNWSVPRRPNISNKINKTYLY